MTPKNRLLIAGVSFIALTFFGLLALTTAYFPFQSVVQVVAPFIVLSIFVSIGVCLILIALLVPFPGQSISREREEVSAVDSLMAETRRR